jgi:hypothetical protein
MEPNTFTHTVSSIFVEITQTSSDANQPRASYFKIRQFVNMAKDVDKRVGMVFTLYKYYIEFVRPDVLVSR